MNHPVKRFKPNDDANVNQQIYNKDLYADQKISAKYLSQLSSQSNKSQKMEGSVKSENCTGLNDSDEAALDAIEIKKEPVENSAEAILNKDGKIENLFTSEGLQASYRDLDQIFDNSDDDVCDDSVMVS